MRATATWRRLSGVAGNLSRPRLARVALEWALRRKFLVVERRLTGTEVRPPPTDATWEVLHGEQLIALREINPRVDLAAMRLRDRAGHLCHAVRHRGRLVHYRWYALQPVELDWLGLIWRPCPGDFLVFDAFTHPEARGRHLANIVSAHVVPPQTPPLRRGLAFIAWWNEPALRWAEGFGYRRTGTVTRWNLLPARRYTASGSARLERGTVWIAPPSA